MSEIEQTRLGILAAEINTEHGKFRSAFKATYQHALKVGFLLSEAKAEVGHGNWLPWVAENCAFSMRTAQTYMRIAKNRDRVEELLKDEDPAHLSMTRYSSP
jgi:ABC-type sulfate/molybdate transport systems ATPase subunit